jgi:hypothetical protein
MAHRGVGILRSLFETVESALHSLHVFSNRNGERALISIAIREPERAILLLSKARLIVLGSEELLAR